MCITGKSLTPEPLSSPKSQPVNQEETIARKCGWFSVRYFRPQTLSGDQTRYIFVNSSQYGIVWANVIFFAIVHCLFAYAFYYVVTTPELRALWIFDYVYGLFGGLGVSAGAHRLWSHKTYNASLPVRIFLMICFTSSGENDIYTWSRDHRLHHKYTETDADPHNSRRGGFFAHVGWLLTRKHPDVLIKGATIDNSDLINDPVVYYNRKFYIPLYLFFRLYLCIALPVWLLDETASNSFFGCFCLYVGQLHTVWFVNSAAHIFGDRPYNNKIQPRENWWVAITGFGEGFHNYHHTFPWDYTIAENGLSYWNPAKWFIDAMYYMGLCSNLKRPSRDLVHKTVCKVKTTPVQDKEFYAYNHPYCQPHKFTDVA